MVVYQTGPNSLVLSNVHEYNGDRISLQFMAMLEIRYADDRNASIGTMCTLLHHGSLITSKTFD